MQKGKYSAAATLATPAPWPCLCVTVFKVVGIATGFGVKIVPAGIFTEMEVPAAIFTEMEVPTTAVVVVAEAVFCLRVVT